MMSAPSVTGRDQTGARSLAPYGWVRRYRATAVAVTAALVGATRSITFTVVPLDCLADAM